MDTVYKETFTKPLPTGAKIIVRVAVHGFKVAGRLRLPSALRPQPQVFSEARSFGRTAQGLCLLL